MVFVFGTVCLDRIRRVPSLPVPGGYVEVESEQILLGGEAANTANALHAWGTEIQLGGNQLGVGPGADRLRSRLAEKGLPVALLVSQDDAEGTVAPVCDIYVTPDGERTMFGQGFAHMNPSRPLEDLPFRPGEWFTVDPNMGERARRAARLAHKAGMRLYTMDFIQETDPVPADSFWQSSTDWVGVRGNVQRNVVWVKDLVGKRGCFAILSDGPNGFVAGSPTHPVRAYPPFPAHSVVDTTGAGDFFRAGMLFCMDQGRPIPEALQFASAAGCLKVGYLGATSHVPTAAEVRAVVAGQPEVAHQYVA